jgi:hypothetical protein
VPSRTIAERLAPGLGLGDHERIVSRAVDLVLARREIDRRVQVANREPRRPRRAIRNEKEGAEELIEETHVPGYDDESGDADVGKERHDLVPLLGWNVGRQHDGNNPGIDERDRGALEVETRGGSYRYGDVVRVEDDGKIDGNGTAVELESEGEVVASEGVVAEKDPLLADLLEGERTGSDLSNKDAIDDFDGRRIGARAEKELTVLLEADVADEVETLLNERWNGKKLPRRPPELNGVHDPGTDELGGDLEPRGQQSQEPCGVDVRIGERDLDSDSGRGVSRDDLTRRIRLDGQPEKEVVKFAQLVVGETGSGGREKENALGQGEPGGNILPSR